jgi:hypothetical protein
MLFWVVTPCRIVGGYQRFGKNEALKMETVSFPETVVSAYESNQRHNPEKHRHPQHRKNLKSHLMKVVFVVYSKREEAPT